MSTITTNENLSTLERQSEAITPRYLFPAFAALFLLNLLLRVFYLRYQFVNGDEAVRALTAANLLEGGRLYLDSVTDKPPGTTFFYAAVFVLFGKSMIAVHLAAALWNFLTSIVLYFIATRIYSKRAGLWAALFYIYFSASYLTQDMLAANTELLMVLPLAASFYLYLCSLQRQDEASGVTLLMLFAVGVLTGIAVLFKQLGLSNAAAFVLSEAFLVYHLRKRESFIPAAIKSLKRLLLIASGIITVFIALVSWLYALQTLDDFWRYVFDMNEFYIEALSTSLWLKFMVGRTFAYIAFNLPLWLLAAWATKRAIANLQSAEANQRAILEASLLSWAGVSLAAVFVGGRFFGHYFIQLLPALSIFAGQGAQLLNVNLLNETKRRKARIFVGFFLLCLLVNVARFHRRTAILAYETLIGKRTSYSQKWGMTEREDEAAIIAQKVREQLNAGDPLYIWGYALDVYWRTGCPPASRFITPNHITGEFEGASGSIAEADHPFWSASRRQFIEDLRRNCPRLILDVTGELVSLPYEDIRTFIEENYRRDGEIGITPTRPFIVYRRLSP